MFCFINSSISAHTSSLRPLKKNQIIFINGYFIYVCVCVFVGSYAWRYQSGSKKKQKVYDSGLEKVIYFLLWTGDRRICSAISVIDELEWVFTTFPQQKYISIATKWTAIPNLEPHFFLFDPHHLCIYIFMCGLTLCFVVVII